MEEGGLETERFEGARRVAVEPIPSNLDPTKSRQARLDSEPHCIMPSEQYPYVQMAPAQFNHDLAVRNEVLCRAVS